MGITFAESSLGGVNFPVLLSHLITDVGFSWIIRIVAFLILAMLLFSNLSVCSRIPSFPKSLRLIDYVLCRSKPLKITMVGIRVGKIPLLKGIA